MRKLVKQKKLSRKEWLKGFLYGTDGKFYVVVDTIFFDRGKQREDDFFYTKEQFREKFSKIR